MQVNHVDKNMVEQSSTVPSSINKEYLKHTLGLTLSTPGLVNVLILSLSKNSIKVKVRVVRCDGIRELLFKIDKSQKRFTQFLKLQLYK